MVKGVLVDYGGTIDTNGLHWAAVLWDSYQKHQIDVDKAMFSKAYSFGERSLAINPIIKPDHSFYDTLYLKIEQQFKFLRENGHNVGEALVASLANPLVASQAEALVASQANPLVASQTNPLAASLAKDCNDFAQQTVNKAKPVLEELAENYPLILVSNFYGNIHKVLEVFGIDHYFKHVIESAVVGIRKPDPQIYQLGVDYFGFLSNECVVIGDSFPKDIVPAKQLGCKAIWLNVKGWEESNSAYNTLINADAEISDFAEALKEIKKLN